jgi:hypothetical protein
MNDTEKNELAVKKFYGIDKDVPIDIQIISLNMRWIRDTLTKKTIGYLNNNQWREITENEKTN